MRAAFYLRPSTFIPLLAEQILRIALRSPTAKWLRNIRGLTSSPFPSYSAT